MRQLPRAGGTEHDELDDHPPHDARVCRLGLVPELGLSFLFVCSGSRVSGKYVRMVEYSNIQSLQSPIILFGREGREKETLGVQRAGGGG